MVTRCEYVWHRPVYPVENGRAAFEEKRTASLTPEELADRERIYSLLEGQQCVGEHPKQEGCTTPDCGWTEMFSEARQSFHKFLVNGEEFFTSGGVSCWDCWRKDCGHYWVEES